MQIRREAIVLLAQLARTCNLTDTEIAAILAIADQRSADVMTDDIDIRNAHHTVRKQWQKQGA